MIHELCKRTESKQIREATATGTPRKLGNKKLWPLTLQSAEWYVWAVAELPEKHHVAALIFAHEKGRDEGAFDEMYDHGYAKSYLRIYARSINARAEEVELVLGELNGTDDGVENHDDPDFEGAVARLVAETGISPEVWRARVSIGYIVKQIDAINAKNGDDTPRSDYIQAEKNIGLALLEIRREAKNGA